MSVFADIVGINPGTGTDADFKGADACYKGSTFKHTITITDENDVAVDLTAVTAAVMDVRDGVGGSLITTLSSATGQIDLTDKASGIIVLTIAHAVTAAFAVGTYDFDLEITDGTSKVKLLSGEFEVAAEYTTSA